MYILSEKLRFIESVFGTGKLDRASKNFDVRCPICAPDDRTKRKLSILVENDKAHCWVCGTKAYTLAPLIKKYGTFEQFNDYKNKYLPKGVIIQRDAQPEVVQIDLPYSFKMLVYADKRDPNVLACWRYLNDRGITETTAWRYKLGYSHEHKWSRRIIVPSFDAQGKLNYFVARAIDSNARLRYDNPDCDRNTIIFNEINVDWTRELVICEGAFDMFNCGENVVPLLGSDMNEETAIFNKIIVNNTPIALALDADMWSTKTPKMAKKLAEYGINVRLVDTRPFGDPGNATKQQLAEALENARVADWNTNFTNRLDSAFRMCLKI